MSAARRSSWIYLHVGYSSPVARLQVIAELRSAPGDRAWFVDVPFATETEVLGGLEIGLRGPSQGRGDQTTAHAWLESAPGAGHTIVVRSIAAPQVLQPTLFPGGIVPSFYSEALAVGSARAAQILAELGEARPAPSSVVREELALTYAALIPHGAERAEALRAHAAWLDQVAQTAAVGEAAAPDGGAAELDPPPAAGYARLRRTMESQIASIAARLRPGDGGVVPPVGSAPIQIDCGAVRAALVARLTHTQVVRLWGSNDANNLRREAALVRDLASYGSNR